MRKIYQYILMAVALVATASCSNELDEALQPAGNGSLQFVVSDFPAFGESPDTRAIGTQDIGKDAWGEDDQIIVTLTSKKYGAQSAVLTYNGTSWSTAVSFLYLDNETPAVSAIYAPCYEVTEDGVMKLIDGMQLGMTEYIPADCSLANGSISINFTGVKRTYSRLRIASEAGQKLTVATTGFTPAGAKITSTQYSLTADENGNAFLYGTFAVSGSVTVKNGDVTIKDYTFSADKHPNGTEQGKSYVLDARMYYYYSVSPDKRVTFSMGNLQYHPKNNVWRFAENQTDYIGSDNINISADYDGWIDLFGWGTGDGPTKSSTSPEDYTTFVDWGTNKIGDDDPDTWRTLTNDEWMYIFHNRPNAQALFALGSVNGVNGTIILPDNWTTPADITFVASTSQGLAWIDAVSGSNYINSNGNNFSHNTYTSEQWSKMEQAGAVFLPASGTSDLTKVDFIGDAGYYWSSTVYNVSNYHLCYVYFNNNMLNPQGYVWGYYGQSVRLVKDVG